MKKNVYSLVLSEQVIAEIDRLAYRRGTNRSGLINSILADYVSYETPEQRIADVFAAVQNVLTGKEDDFRLMAAPSETMLSLRSALCYKYNPTVRYSLELYRGDSPYVGELRVSMRTQNARLVELVMDFYRVWITLEARRLGHQAPCLAEGGRYTRMIDFGGGGDAIAAYIRTFDQALKFYFADTADRTAAVARIDRLLAASISLFTPAEQ